MEKPLCKSKEAFLIFSFSLNVDALNKKYTINEENLLLKQFEVLNQVLYFPVAKSFSEKGNSTLFIFEREGHKITVVY